MSQLNKYSPKIMYISLDAAARNLIFRWSSEGLLPHMKALLNSSARAMTRNSPGIYTGSLWPTVWTGTTPGEHGCYFNQQIIPGSYKTAEFLGKEVKRQPFWNDLQGTDHRLCLFDVPKTPLTENLNGIQIVDWGTHDSDIPACSWPPSLITEINDKYGKSAFRRCDWVMRENKPEQTLKTALLGRIDQKVAIAQDLLQREPWDLFMIGFGESHCVGHQLWHVHDPEHPLHNRELRKEIGDPVFDVYKALDDAVGRLLEFAGPETTVLLHCSHGMAAHYDGSSVLDEVLLRLEGRNKPVIPTLMGHARRQWKKLPRSITERVGTLADWVRRLPDASSRANRRCFPVPTNGNAPGIRLNLQGREPAGMINPGKEEDEYVASLIADLEALEEVGDGRKVVREVIRSRDSFPGPSKDLLPDLFIRWNRRRPILGVKSPKVGTVMNPKHISRRTGDHRMGGLILLRKQGISAGTVIPNVHDEDIAPTLASFLGEKLEQVNGRSFI